MRLQRLKRFKAWLSMVRVFLQDLQIIEMGFECPVQEFRSLLGQENPAGFIPIPKGPCSQLV